MFASTPESVETYRKPRSTLLLIDSADRSQVSTVSAIGTNNLPAGFTQPLNDFTIQKRQAFVSGFFHRIGVVEARFEFNSPNVNARNNKIVVRTGGPLPTPIVSYTITVPEGFYTPDGLAAELQAQLIAQIASSTWTVVYDSDTFTFTITNVSLSGSATEFFLAPFAYGTQAQILKGLFYIMGFSLGNGAVASGVFTQISTPFPSMCYTRYIDICSRQLTQYQKAKDNSTRENQVPAVLCRLYLSNYSSEGVGDGDSTARQLWPGCAPAVIYRYFNVPKMSNWSSGAFVDQIDIELRDDAGNLLYIPGQSTDEVENATYSPNNFQITLQLSES
jgi:hypothetical protein